jgi:hypothetical protein
LGAGTYTTLVMHVLCAHRYLLTADHDKAKTLARMAPLASQWHEFVHADTLITAPKGDEKAGDEDDTKWGLIGRWTPDILLPEAKRGTRVPAQWGVVWVDHIPELRRKNDIRRLHKRTQALLYHDAERATIGYMVTDTFFEHKFLYESFTIQTCIVSNFQPVTKWFGTSVTLPPQLHRELRVQLRARRDEWQCDGRVRVPRPARGHHVDTRYRRGVPLLCDH